MPKIRKYQMPNGGIDYLNFLKPENLFRKPPGSNNTWQQSPSMMEASVETSSNLFNPFSTQKGQTLGAMVRGPQQSMATITPKMASQVDPSVNTLPTPQLIDPNRSLPIERSTDINTKKPFMETKAGGILGGLSTKTGLGDTAIQALGGREATLQGAGDQALKQISSAAWKGALKTGNPWLIAGAGVLKGVDYLNRYGGKTANKQGTDASMSIKGYGFQASANAGAKATFFGELFAGKNKKKIPGINAQTKRAERHNILGAASTYSDNQNQLSAENSYRDITARTSQRLAGGINTNILAARKGAKIPPKSLSNIKKRVQRKVQDAVKEIENTQELEQLNVIPEGALHARKNNLPEEIADQVTHKGIPVITYEEGNKIKQHAEIERSEIIFNKEVSIKLESLFKEYKNASDKEKKELEIECGKLLTFEILEKTIDNVGLLKD